MNRLGLLGLLVVVACGGQGEEDGLSQALLCPGVVAGALPDEAEAQDALSRTGEAEDGRQRFLIRYRDGRTLSASRVASLGGRVLRAYELVPAVAAKLTPEEHDALARDPDVVSIEPDVQRRALGMTDTAGTGVSQLAVQQGSIGEYTPGINAVHAPWVWDKDLNGVLDPGRPNGEGITVCVIDSGVDPTHPELEGVIVGGRDFVDGDNTPWDQGPQGWGTGHGTHVAGIIAAQLSSGSANVSPQMDRNGVVGVAPGARLLIVRVLNTDGVAWVSDIIAGLEWCQRQGAHISSLSLGGQDATLVEREAYEKLAQGGMLVVAAAGNSGRALDYPAAYPSVLAVGAVDSGMRRARFSAHGFNLSLMAPGVSVISTVIQKQGTMSEVKLGELAYDSRPLFMAPTGTRTGRLVDCGEGDTLASCPKATCSGFVAYVDLSRKVPLSVQIANVMKQGAQAVLVADQPRNEEDLPDLSIGRPGRWQPAALVSHDEGVAMRLMMGLTAHVELHMTDYAYSSGTSMAAPHVAGVAALVWSARPDTLTAADVRQLLQSTAADLGAPGKDIDYGYGLVDAQAALEALEARR